MSLPILRRHLFMETLFIHRLGMILHGITFQLYLMEVHYLHLLHLVIFQLVDSKKLKQVLVLIKQLIQSKFLLIFQA